ncbi:hypothetical protein ABFX02_03G088900 [Erythranthe guttata]
MEGDLSSPSTMRGNPSYGGFDFHLHHNPNRRQPSSIAHHTIHENFPLTIRSTQDFDQSIYGKSASEEDEPSVIEERKGKKSSSSPWQRVKWTDTMVRLLITAVSYISEEASSEHSRRNLSNLQKKGKWKSVSKAMAERGHLVSPQQCEDKFNDLNKRYKRLNEILGRGTSCEVVENPELLDVMDRISEKNKEEVRKILSSKHLHYEEMCSYHNGNRLHLPHDSDLQRSLKLALLPKDDCDGNEFDDLDGSDENRVVDLDPGRGPGKRVKHSEENLEDFGVKDSLNALDCNKTFDENQALNEDANTSTLQKQWMSRRNVQLEEKRLHIQVQTLELEKERFKWQRFCRKQDRELEMMKMEIERMKLENERMALELRRKEMGIIDNN